MSTATADPSTEGTPADPDSELDRNQADGAVHAAATQQQLSLLPQIDGLTRNRLRLTLSGTIELEVDDARDAGLLEKLRLSSKAELEIVGTGVRFEVGADSKSDKVRRSNDGYVEQVVHSVVLRTLSITHPTSEADQVAARGQ